VNASPFVRSLPQFFAFCHAALDQLKRDTVNYHLSQLAPRFHFYVVVFFVIFFQS